MKFDMHALMGMTVEWSDDDGASWNGPSVATQIYSVQDHQTIASKQPAGHRSSDDVDVLHQR